MTVGTRVTFCEPVPDPTLGLADKIKLALIGQEAKITNQIRDCVRVDSAAISLKDRERLSRRSGVFRLIDHAYRVQPAS
jgi:hypothetical protein